MRGLDTLKAWARSLKQHTLILWFAARDRRTPWPVRLLALVIVAYAFSPIDLIPDFIPVLGLLDDLLLLPLGIALLLRLMPPAVMETARQAAAQATERPVSRGATVAVVALWVLAIVLLWRWLSK